jgi:DNA-binding response OmpR family regulator
MTTATRPFDGVPIQVLLIEDSEDDYRRVCGLLAAARHASFVLEWARSIKDATVRLAAGAYDVCLIDQGLPDGEGSSWCAPRTTAACARR